MIKNANQSGILAYLVIKPSIKPAMIKNGMVLTTTFNPSLAPFIKETRLENVLGNKILLPIIRPAHPAIMITEISIVPCSHICLLASKNTPLV